MRDNMDAVQKENERLQQQAELLKNQRDAYKEQLNALKNSFSWRITKPLRWVLLHSDFIKNFFLFCKGIFKVGIADAVSMERERRREKRDGLLLLLSDRERKRQNEEARQREAKYYFLLRIWKESSEEELQHTLETLDWQTLPAVGAVLWVDGERAEEIRSWNAAKARQIVPVGNNGELFSAIEQDAAVIYCEAGDCFSEGCLFEVEQYQQVHHSRLFYMDEAWKEPRTGKFKDFHYKPDFSPHYLYSDNYIGHVLGMRAEILFHWIGAHSVPEEASFAYYFLMEIQEKEAVDHIPEALFGRMPRTEQEIQREQRACESYWNGRNEGVLLRDGLYRGSRHLLFPVNGTPKVSVIIPNCDHVEDLRKCIQSMEEKTDYDNYEVIIVENNSKTEEIFEYYGSLEQKEKIRVITWDGPFNYSAINNYAAGMAQGDYLLLLNNDIEVISPSWLTEMLMYAQRREAGAVGAKLYFPDDTIQHAGVVLGVRGLAGHGHRNFGREADGYMHRLKVVQDYSAVTAACLLISKDKFWEINGFDETLAVDYNDVDLCLKLRQKGYYNVFTPYAQLYHYESKSRGGNTTPEKEARVEQEYYYFVTKWYHCIKGGDPFYNDHLTLLEDDFSIAKKGYEWMLEQ